MILLYTYQRNIPFKLHVFWQPDRIKLKFSESVSLFLKTRLLTLLNMLQETSDVTARLKMEFFMKRKGI